jgi:hypothetical protein
VETTPSDVKVKIRYSNELRNITSGNARIMVVNGKVFTLGPDITVGADDEIL